MNLNTKNIPIVFLLTSILLAATAPPLLSITKGASQLRKVGVNEGDWAKYGNITVTWSSNDPKAEPEPSLILANQTVWFKHTVTKVEGSGITFRNETYFKSNETETNEAWVDIEQGFGNGVLMFISSGLQNGSLLYVSSNPPLFINETLSRTYLGVKREVNHLNLTFNDNQTNPPSFIQLSFNYYWDRKTGILTERQASFFNKTGEYQTSWFRSDIIIDTNLWVTDTQPPKADAGNDKTISQGETVYFDASGSTDNVGIVSYEWDFGDGTTITKTDPFTTHIYTEPGTYIVILKVKDGAEMTSIDQISVVVKSTSNSSFPSWALAITAIILFGVLVLYIKIKSASKARKRRIRRLKNK